MKLDGAGLLAAADKLQQEAGWSAERATWVAGLMLSAYFGSDQPLKASAPDDIPYAGGDSTP